LARAVGLKDYELRPDARRFETWETNYATRLGLLAASEYAFTVGLDAIEARCRALARRLRERLDEVRGAILHDLGRTPSAIVSFTLAGIEAEEVVQRLQARHINVSVLPPSSTPLDAVKRHLPPLIRASPHYYNTDVSSLEELMAGLGS